MIMSKELHEARAYCNRAKDDLTEALKLLEAVDALMRAESATPFGLNEVVGAAGGTSDSATAHLAKARAALERIK